MGVKEQLRLIKNLLSLEFKSAMEYRFNFILQSMGMIINDIFWLAFWYIFFLRFESINGWDFNSMLYVYALALISWGGAFVVFGNIRNISQIIEEGKLDYYLALPKEVLSHLCIRLRYGTLGDFVLGVVLFVIVIPVLKWPLFISLAISSILVFMGFSILLGSLTFFFGKFERAAKLGMDTLLTFSLYPFSVYGGVSKFLLLFIVPAGFAIGMPIEILQDFDLTRYISINAFAIFIFVLSILVFYKGLRRYESGSMINVRT